MEISVSSTSRRSLLQNHNQQKVQNKQPQFKGWFGCKLGKIVVQSDSVMGTYVNKVGDIWVGKEATKLAQQLQTIGKREGFEVIAQHARSFDYALKNISDKIRYTGRKMSPWAQDNGHYFSTSEGEKIIDSATTRETEKNLLKKRAKHFGIDYKKMESRVDGGNAFCGIDNNGQRFLLTGKDSIYDTALKLALDEQGIHMHHIMEASNGTIKISCDEFGEKLFATTLKKIRKGQFSGNKEIQSRIKKAMTLLEQNKEEYNAKAVKSIARDFELEPSQLKFVSQPGFHIDMEMRPLMYPNILVNDPKLTYSLLEKEIEHAPNCRIRRDLTKILNQTKKLEGKKEKEFGSKEIMIKELEDYGFNVIRVPGVFGKGETNFMNALVHERDNGELVYITGCSNYSNDKVNLNKLFEKAVSEKTPIAKFDFIGDIPSTPIMNALKKKPGNYKYINETYRYEDGGPHCHSFEMPDKAWMDKKLNILS